MPRVILAVANELDHDFVWDQLKTLQADMFGAGPVAVKFAYLGREGVGMATRPYVSTRWVSDPDDMVHLMSHARANCICGCFALVSDIFAEALKEPEPVEAIVVVGDHFHYPDLPAAKAQAEALRARGTRVFMFQQGSRGNAGPFRALAEQTGGAYFQFNPAVERVAERLPSLLKAVTQYAIGGTQALEALEDQSADLLLEQMTNKELGKPS